MPARTWVKYLLSLFDKGVGISLNIVSSFLCVNKEEDVLRMYVCVFVCVCTRVCECLLGGLRKYEVVMTIYKRFFVYKSFININVYFKQLLL